MSNEIQKLSVALNDVTLQKYDKGWVLYPVFIDKCVCGNLNVRSVDAMGDIPLCPGCKQPLKTDNVVAYIQSYKHIKVALEYITETKKTVIVAHNAYPQCALVDLDMLNNIVLPYEKRLNSDIERMPISYQHAQISVKATTRPIILTMQKKEVAALIHLNTYYNAILLGKSSD